MARLVLVADAEPMTLEGQSMEERVEEIVVDVLNLSYDLPRPRSRTTIAPLCETCGARHEQNLDIYGQPNGYRAHQLGTCLTNMRDTIVMLRDRIEQLESACFKRE
jgi:hypothetical protein